MLDESLKSNGFTLVEVMIVVAIAAILFAIALPSYQDQVRRTKRSDGKGFLLEVAAAQERFFTQNVRYTTDAGDLGYANSRSPEEYYRIRINYLGGDNTTFRLRAIPRGSFTDDECGTLILFNTGVRRSSSGNSDDCWN